MTVAIPIGESAYGPGPRHSAEADAYSSLVAPLDPTVSLERRATHHMEAVTARYQDDLAWREVTVPAEPEVVVDFEPLRPAEVLPGHSEPAGTVLRYSTLDPWQEENPALVDAVGRLTDGTIAVTEMVEAEIKEKRDAGVDIHPKGLTYVNSRRNGKGKNLTVVTRELCTFDDGLEDWITHLPEAERLHPVAHPDEGTFVLNEAGDGIDNIPSTLALQALAIGSKNGRAVRERTAVMHTMLPHLVDLGRLAGQEVIRLADMGSGTGDPGQRSAVSLLQHLGPEAYALVNGYDLNPKSLKVAEFMCRRLAATLPDPSKLRFVGHETNFLTKEGLDAVAEENPDIWQSFGFTEYVPADETDDPVEQAQRKSMARMGLMSAEEFHAGVYERMKPGAVWLTGNIQPNPEGKFVTHGLGWGNIIERSLRKYIGVFDRGGIPPKARTLFQPHARRSGAVYNLMAVTKL